MHGVHSVLPLLAGLLNIEVREIRCESVSVQEQDMVGVNLADSRVYLVIPSLESLMCGVARLVKGVISSNPRVTFKVCRDLLP